MPAGGYIIISEAILAYHYVVAGIYYRVCVCIFVYSDGHLLANYYLVCQ